VLAGFTSVAGTTEKDCIGTSGAEESELIKGHALATSLFNAGTSGFGETESAHIELGGFPSADIISDGANEDGDLVFLTSHVLGQTGDGHGSTVGPALEESAQNNFVERRARTAGKEPVELHSQAKVGVLTARLCPLATLDTATSFQVDTLLHTSKKRIKPLHGWGFLLVGEKQIYIHIYIYIIQITMEQRNIMREGR